MQIIDCEQGTAEWLAARLGIPTASMFGTVLAKGRGGGDSTTRRSYMLKLAGEVLTGEPMERYSNGHMERGHEMEAEARDLYAFMQDVEPRCVGFIRNGNKGGSPDSLVGDDGGVEIKTALPHIQIERLLAGKVPPEHLPQVQGNIWIAEREWWDFVSYWPKLPPLIVRAYRDEPYIKALSAAVDQFNEDLAGLVERIRHYQEPAKLTREQLVRSLNPLVAG